MIVENGCVHQHFNDDPDNEAILLVFKAKPLFLFMHLLFQKIVSFPPNTLPGATRTSAADGSLSRTVETPMKAPDERDFAHVGDKDAARLPRRRRAASPEFRIALRRAAQRGDAGGDAVRALARRPHQASRPSQDEHARALRRSLYAVPAARRPLGQAPPHVGGGALRGRGRAATTCTGTSSSTASTPFEWEWEPEPRKPSNGSAAISSTCRRSPSTSISIPRRRRRKRG